MAEQIRAMGAQIISWDDATRTQFHLVLAASDNSDLHELTGPLLLVPHGAGYQKYSPHSEPATGARTLSGFAASALWHNGRPVPARVGLSHANQLSALANAAPELVDRAAVIGDPCVDRLAGLTRERNRLRSWLGLRPGQELIVVASTWGADSTMGRWPSLPTELLAQLPHDEFRVAAILHPNVWVFHSNWQVRQWLARAAAAGLIIVPPTGPWKPVLAAADCVISDHGSLSAYSTGLRRPLLLAAFSATEVPAGTSMADLGAHIPRLDREQPLAAQVRDAIATVDEALLDRLAAGVFAHRGEALTRLRAVMYELLNLTPPPWPPIMPAPAHTEPLPRTPLRAYRVAIEFGDADPTVAIMSRYPAILDNSADQQDGNHLVVGSDAPDERLVQNAAVVVADQSMATSMARTWASATLSELPGCRIAAAPDESGALFALLRDGRAMHAHTDDAVGDPYILASALHCQLLRHPGRSDLPNLVVANGSHHITVVFRSL
ncbi:hypothetical protein [Nocardia cyriacigeorgica]|uniref:Translation initiation factor 2 n=1 Tax=Nocardia cyriacigeorgica TaxID=135487 RepID=A0A5R8NBB3_9NOCA|nr:hypothetical protein [Nocardia cyriacigeorgica]TLF72958.1 hypothetical protein FEK34_28475 [Nocardia cyriacigeorgica]